MGIFSLRSVSTDRRLLPALLSAMFSCYLVPAAQAQLVWSQQGSNLVVAVGPLAMSADGNTAIFGAEGDVGAVGGASVYTRSNGVWTQQGAKLVGTGAVGGANQGSSVAMSADGNTDIVGGRSNNHSAGAAWVYVRTNGTWSQQGTKLVGTGAVRGANQGYSVGPQIKAGRWRFPRTGTRPLWARPVTMAREEPCGHMPAAAACGVSRAPNWWARVL